MDNETKALLAAKLDNNLNVSAMGKSDHNFGTGTNTDNKMVHAFHRQDNTVDLLYRGSAWDFWQEKYYPHIVESYPVYIRDRAEDKGKQAFEIIKMLKDSQFLKLETVGDFIDLMDKLIKIL